MKFSYNWLNSFFEEDLPKPQKLADKLMMRFFEVEEVKKVGDDALIDIDILPNRASDCFSHLGVAREIAAIYNLSLKEPEIEFKSGSKELTDFVDLKIKNELTPRYVLRGIKGIEIKETPEFIKKRLEVCGLQSINNIVDITNYVMLEMGQPLHAFDGGKVGDLIQVRAAKKDEKIITLDEEEKSLDGSILVIADDKEPIGIAGIKGGKGTEIDEKTDLIYLEAANFDGKTIRKGSKKLKLQTDASIRFSHGLDPELAEKASRRAIKLMEKYANGKPLKGSLDLYPDPVTLKTIDLSIKKTESLLGVKISEEKIIKILESLGFEVKKESDLEVKIPTERRDISIEEDLIEEIGRLYGYENIESKKPKAEVEATKKPEDLFWEDRLREVFKASGFTEAYNYTFIDEKVKEIFGYDDLVEMKNPVSAQYRYLRPRLIPHLIKNIKDNEKRFEDIKIFEIGKVFSKKEEISVGAIASNLNFREMKGVLNSLLTELNISDVGYERSSNSWAGEKAAKVLVGNQEIGQIGEVSKELTENMKLESKPIVFQLKLEKIVKLASKTKRYKKFSRFPVAMKDVSVLVPVKVNFEEVLTLANKAAGEDLIETDLFDLYQGEKIPEGTKNLGLRFHFQAEDKTLSKEEIDKLLEKIISSLEAKSGWKVRKK